MLDSATETKNLNLFEIAASFYNPKAGYWEPIIEKWLFSIEIILSPKSQVRNRIDLVSELPLNIDISNEMVAQPIFINNSVRLRYF